MGEEGLDCDTRTVFVIALLVLVTLFFILFPVCFRCVDVFF